MLHNYRAYHLCILTNGFEIQRVVEPQPPAHMMELEGMRDEMRRPMMLIVAARKQ